MTAPAVEISDLSFSYDGEPVLTGVSLTLAPGDFVGVVGPNGGGKTTLVKLILGLLRPTSGQVRVFGERPHTARRRIGYVPQSFAARSGFPVTVAEVVLMGRLRRNSPLGRYGRADRAAAEDALDRVALGDLAHRPMESLSGGQRQRVLIARGLAAGADMLILDEPTASVDVTAEAEIHAVLQELNRDMTIILVTHDLSFITGAVQTVYCVSRRVTRHETHPLEHATEDLIRRMYALGMKMVHHDECCEGRDDPC